MKQANYASYLTGKAKAILAVLGAAVVAYWALTGIMISSVGRPVETPVSAQRGDAYLSRRIDQVENRFYGIESRLNRLESESRVSTISPSLSQRPNDVEIQFFRTQIDSLRTRLGEAECALLKLDERTLTPTSRTARKKAANAGTDRCREERDTPVQLSARP